MGFHYHPHGFSDEEYQRKLSSRFLISKLLSYFLLHRKKIGIVIFSMIVTSVTNAIKPYILGREIIANYIAQSNIQGLQLMVFIFLGILLVDWIFQSIRRYYMGWIGEHMLLKIRAQLFSHLQDLSFSFFDQMKSGDLLSRITNDVDNIGENFSSETIMVVSEVLSLSLVMTFMFLLNVQLTLVSMIVIPIMILLSFVFQPKFRKAYRKTRTTISEVTTNLEEGISGIREIQSFSREKSTMEKFNELNIENLRANVQATKVWGTFNPTIQMVQAIGSAIVMLYGGRLALNGTLGSPLEAIGILTSFLIYVQMFFRPILDLSNFYNVFQSALASAERIFELLDVKSDVTDTSDAVELPSIKGNIKFDMISFGYDSNHPVLHTISFKANQGETIAIVGPTGAGKSTIIKLLSRFYDPQGGTIQIDNYKLRQIKQNSLRRQIGTVLQESFLFNDTIMENIRYGKIESTDEKIINTAKKIGAHKLIMQLPEGYKTQVGERGTNLSQGQRQLISFTRALLRDPPILILDEATSSIDPYTELLIQKALRVIFKNRTSIVIAHRLSTVRNADKILVINDGKIIERGIHKELLKRRGLYYHLYQMQFKDKDIPRTEKLDIIKEKIK
jgi:ATP-binding cassette subfamily B protein